MVRFCKVSNFFKRNYDIIIVLFIAAILYCVLYGLQTLNPLNIEWLCASGADLSQGYYGWIGFKNSNWVFPIGLTNKLCYPDYTCIVYTDSIPVLALPMKLFRNILPSNFQYYGFWGFLCFIFTGFFTVKIIRIFSVNKIYTIIFSLPFLISPTILHRLYMHAALGGQWLIICCIYLCLTSKEISLKKNILRFSVLGMLSVLIHMYLFAMCAIIVLVNYLADVFVYKKYVSFLYKFIPFVSLAAISFALLGGFSISITEASIGGYGVYSSNLNCFINSLGNSLFIPGLKTNDGQYEGFCYLGLGVILLMIICLPVYIIQNKNEMKKHWKLILIYGLFSLFIFLYSVSNIIYFNDCKIIDIHLPSILLPITNLFRASGRFNWINLYLFYFISIYMISKTNFKSPKTNFIFHLSGALLCLVQLVDLLPMMSKTFVKYRNLNYTSQLKETSFWNQISCNKGIKHVILTEDFNHFLEDDSKLAYSVADFALKNDFSLNTFYINRNNIYFDKNFDEVFKKMDYSSICISPNKNLFCHLSLKNVFTYKIDNLFVSTPFSVNNYKTVSLREEEYKFEFNGRNLENGYDKDGMRFLNENGISYGPNNILAQGMYNVTINGNNLNRCTVKAYSSSRNKEHEIQFVCVEENKINFKFNITEYIAKRFEIVITNKDKTTAILNEIILKI